MLKRAVLDPPCLLIADPALPFELAADACDVAVGATLMQRSGPEDRLRPVAFESKKLSAAEINYPIREKELLAIVHACRVWRHFLHGRTVRVHSDHQSLSTLLKQQQVSPRVHRWLEMLADFDIQIQYEAGESPLMRIPDALSRRPDLLTGAPDAQGVTGDLDCVGLLERMGPEDLQAAAERHPSVPADVAALVECGGCVATVELNAGDLSRGADTEARIRVGYTTDPFFSPLLPYLRKPDKRRPPSLIHRLKRFELRDGLIYMYGRLCIPNLSDVRCDVMHDCHDAPAAGHLGIEKTYLLAQRHFFWPGMSRDVRLYVSGCHACQINKPRCIKPPGLLQPLPASLGYCLNGFHHRLAYDHCWTR